VQCPCRAASLSLPPSPVVLLTHDVCLLCSQDDPLCRHGQALGASHAYEEGAQPLSSRRPPCPRGRRLRCSTGPLVRLQYAPSPRFICSRISCSVPKAADDEASSSTVTKATSDIVETTLHVFETTSNVAEATPKNTETTVNAPAIIFTPLTEEDAEWTWPHAEYEGVAAEDTPEDELPRSAVFSFLLRNFSLIRDVSHDTLLSLSFSWSLVPGIPRTSSYDQASLVSGASREIISATPGATTIPEVIVTSATASTIEADEAEATKEQAQTLPTGNDLIGLSKTSTITSLELGPVKSDGDAEKHTNEVTLVDHESDTAHAHTYVHGADLFTIVEADKPLESSTSEAKIPRFVPSLVIRSPLTHVLSSTLRSFPSPFSRGNLSIKDIDALMSSGLETESYVFVLCSAL
jgi:hypothetical protein